MTNIALHHDKDYSLVIVMPETDNKYYAMAAAQLHCTCQEYQTRGLCRHIHSGEPKFRQWKTAQQRRLRREIVGEIPLDVLADSLAQEYGIDFFADKIIPHPTTAQEIYIQKETPLDHRYADGCGFGTGGREVIQINTYPASSLLTLLSNERADLINTWAYDLDRFITLSAEPLPKLPPRIPFTTSPENAKSGNANGADHPFASLGYGLVDLSQEVTPHLENQARNDRFAWAISLTGLELVDEGYQGGYQYFPAMTRQGQPIGALALDLAQMKLKSIPVGEVHRYRDGIPSAFQNAAGHVHLPWGVEEIGTVHAQVIIQHPHQPTLNRDGDLLLLTTNFWCQFDDGNPNATFLQLPKEIAQLAGYAAEVMIRLGHNPESRLYYGEASDRVAALAAQVYNPSEDKSGDTAAMAAFAWLYLHNRSVPAELAQNLREGALAYLLPENT